MVEDRDDDVTMATMPSCPPGRRGGVSAEVYREEDAACYVKKVQFACFIHSSIRAYMSLKGMERVPYWNGTLQN